MSEQKGIQALVSVMIVVGASWYFWGGGLDNQVEKEMDKIEQQVAVDMVNQYKIAKRNGSAMDAYVQACFVAAAYLQAEDEENYRKWKEIEKREAKIVGMPE